MAKKRSNPMAQAERTKADDYFILGLRQIRANTYQPRSNGVIPALHAAGYGLFEKLKGHQDKMPFGSC